ncbi:hypothetical protein BUALT_Bualt03G0125900 [Buddleja alternifolia]|uniref:Terpene synthase N-terminal domain-containing protein n=1 Tax=Buddleja alternifolia TaxID=168488 RepID=A0AAV6XT82_9LAMI|nr:hypothetical protein BUALT_Bualt03G0125900 [Buddleja alternifolia]
MEMYQSAAPTSTKNVDLEDVRRSVSYHPNVWGDYFLAYASDPTELSHNEEKELQKLREDVRKVLIATPDESVHKLELIDAIQRLGVAYHLGKETDISLKLIYETYSEQMGSSVATACCILSIARLDEGHVSPTDESSNGVQTKRLLHLLWKVLTRLELILGLS